MRPYFHPNDDLLRQQYRTSAILLSVIATTQLNDLRYITVPHLITRHLMTVSVVHCHTEKWRILVSPVKGGSGRELRLP